MEILRKIFHICERKEKKFHIQQNAWFIRTKLYEHFTMQYKVFDFYSLTSWTGNFPPVFYKTIPLSL